MNTILFKHPDYAHLKQEFMVVDMHHHTKHSHDSGTPVHHVIEQAEKLGIYVAITDHNSITGAMRARGMPGGEKWVIPGIEIATKEKKDVLVYFYTFSDLEAFFTDKVKPHLKQKNSLRLTTSTYPIKDLLMDLAGLRCLVVLPHPVCARVKSTYHYFQGARAELLRYVHGIEVINETMRHRNNLTALGWATSLGKPITAGSDGHRPNTVGAAVTAAKASSKEEFLDAVKRGETIVRGTELRLNERFRAGVSLVREKAKFRKNRKLEKMYD